MSNNRVRIGSRVEFQNQVGTIVGRDGSAWVMKPNGSNARITVPEDQLSLVLNEGHMASERMSEFREMMNS